MIDAGGFDRPVLSPEDASQARVDSAIADLNRTSSITGEIRPDATALPGKNPEGLDFERARLEQLRATAFTPEETATAVT